MSKQCLSIEQMKHLHEIGLDTSKAMMCYRRRTRDFRGEEKVGRWSLVINQPFIVSNFETYEEVPTFTLPDILDVLPKDISREGCTWSASLYIDYENNRIAYGNTDRDGFEIYYEVPICENIIDAAYEILCWCIENSYIPTNK